MQIMMMLELYKKERPLQKSKYKNFAKPMAFKIRPYSNLTEIG